MPWKGKGLTAPTPARRRVAAPHTAAANRRLNLTRPLEEPVRTPVRHRRSCRHRPAVLARCASVAGRRCGRRHRRTAAGVGVRLERRRPSPVATPDKITIAYQLIPNGDLVVKHEGWLEEALPDTEIEWKQFDSGGEVNEAIVAGSVDFGLAGSAPCRRGLSHRHRVPGAVDLRRHRRRRGPRREGRDDQRARRPQGQEDRHAVRVDVALLACSPRSRTPASPRPTSTSSTPSPTTSTPPGPVATSTAPTSGTRTWPR